MTYISAGLRKEVTDRAGECCEYCLLSQEDVLFTFHIEHIISLKHDGATVSENLCLSCRSCNSFKGSDIATIDPLTGNPTFLFHPRRQTWSDHFQLNGALIEPLTPEGRATVFLLRLNANERLAERMMLIAVDRYPCHKN